MRLDVTSLSVIAASIAVSQAAPASSTGLQTRAQTESLLQAIEEINAYKEKRDVAAGELTKREYDVVTKVLAAINDTNLAPKVLKYFATNSKIEPIVVKTTVSLISSGKLNLELLFDSLSNSNLIGTVTEDLISDCSLYEKLFNIAKPYISNLASKVEAKIKQGVSSLTSKREIGNNANTIDDVIVERDVEDVLTNLLESLGDSGLATSVVKSVLTDSSYLPFAKDLVTQLLQSKSLNVSQILTAVKNSGLVTNLFKQILTVDTLKTVATNAFAAFAGDCSSSVASSSPSTSTGSTSKGSSGDGSAAGSDSGSSTGCQKKRRRRRRRNYIH